MTASRVQDVGVMKVGLVYERISISTDYGELEVITLHNIDYIKYNIRYDIIIINS